MKDRRPLLTAVSPGKGLYCHSRNCNIVNRETDEGQAAITDGS